MEPGTLLGVKRIGESPDTYSTRVKSRSSSDLWFCGGASAAKIDTSWSHDSVIVRVSSLANLSNGLDRCAGGSSSASSLRREIPPIPSSSRAAHHRAATALPLRLFCPTPRNHSTEKRESSLATRPNEWNIRSKDKYVDDEGACRKLSSGNEILASIWSPVSSISRAADVLVTVILGGTNSRTDNKRQPQRSIPPFGPRSNPTPAAIAPSLEEPRPSCTTPRSQIVAMI